MVGWHHQLDGHEFEQTQGVGDEQGGLACCSPWDRRESDRTEQLSNKDGRLETEEQLKLQLKSQDHWKEEFPLL